MMHPKCYTVASMVSHTLASMVSHQVLQWTILHPLTFSYCRLFSETIVEIASDIYIYIYVYIETDSVNCVTRLILNLD